MKLKGIRTIALLVAAVILVIGSVAGLTVVRDRCGNDDLGYDAGGIAPGHHCGVHHDPIARVQDIPGPDYGAGEEYPACKCYYDIWKCTTSRWWEVLPLTPYQREQVREIMLHVFDYHVGLEIRGMSACAFRGLATSMCPTLWEEGLRAFWYYAQERGLDFPRRILKAARQPTPPFIPPPDAYYWWEFVRPERQESQIRVTKRDLEVRREYAMRRYWYEIPEVDIMTLTPEQLRCLFDLPRLERRPWLLPLEEIRYTPGAIAVHGEVRQGLTKAEVLQWMDALHKVRDLLCLYMLLENLPEDIEAPYPRYIIESFATQIYGTLVLNFNTCNLTLEEAHSLIPGFYAKIAAKAEEIGIEAVPVVFSYGRVRLDLAQEDWGTSGSPPHPSYDLRYRPIIGGILHEITNAEGWGTIGFSVARPCPQRGWTVDYAITGHAGPTHRPTRVGAAVWQPRRLGGVPCPGDPLPLEDPKALSAASPRAGWVADAPRRGQALADVARVCFCDHNIAPQIHIGQGQKSDVTGWISPIVGWAVKKSGAASGRTSGVVVGTVFGWRSPSLGYMVGPVMKATYYSRGGDSGSPVYICVGDGAVWLVGIHIGRYHVWCPQLGEYEWFAVFSPICAVIDELHSWTPFTIYMHPAGP